MLGRVLVVAGGLVASAVVLALWGGAWRPRQEPTLAELVDRGELRKVAIPPVVEGGQPGRSRLFDWHAWHRIGVADLDQLLAEVDPRGHTDTRRWIEVVRRHAQGGPVLVGNSWAVVASRSGGATWILAPRSRAPNELRGLASEPATGRVDCSCREKGIVCVLAHEDVLRCMRRPRDRKWPPQAGETYFVFIDEPYPAAPVVFPNMLTPVKALFGERGR